MVHMEKMKAAVFAAVAACAGIAFAGVSESFESVEAGSLPAEKWTGDGTVKAEAATEPTGGFPILGNHAMSLSIDGEVTCADVGTSGAKAQIDLLMKVDEPGDELTASDVGDGKIAVAAGDSTTLITVNEVQYVALKAYCKAKGAAADWVTVGEISIGAWHRVTLKFDYANNLCQISVDGVPAVSQHGYLNPSNLTDTESTGSWYGLVGENLPTSSSVEKITFSGCALVDDVVITDNAGMATAPAPTGNATIASGEVSSVPYSTLAKFGVDATTINSATLDGTGMTVAKQLACGIEPGSGIAFKATDMALSSAGVPTITFPGSATAKNGVTPNYTIKVYAGDTDVTDNFDQGTTTAAATNGYVTKSVTPKSGYTVPKVLKFKVTAGAAAAPSGN